MTATNGAIAANVNGGSPKVIASAETLLPSKGIAEDVAFWTSEELGFRMDQIYPADNPQVVALSGHGMRMRLDASAATSPGVIRLLCNEPGKAFGGKTEFMSPSGTRVEIADADLRWPQPPTQHAFMTRRLKDNTPWVIGRAGSKRACHAIYLPCRQNNKKIN